jgi:hypothetical protein
MRHPDSVVKGIDERSPRDLACDAIVSPDRIPVQVDEFRVIERRTEPGAVVSASNDGQISSNCHAIDPIGGRKGLPGGGDGECMDHDLVTPIRLPKGEPPHALFEAPDLGMEVGGHVMDSHFVSRAPSIPPVARDCGRADECPPPRKPLPAWGDGSKVR